MVATDWKALDQARLAGVQYKISFRYPNDTQFAAASKPVDSLPPNTGLERGRRYEFGYEYATRTRQHWLIPEAVYDDGQFTYLRMSDLKDLPTGNFPAVFGRDREGGEDFVVNTTVEGNTVVVHGTYPYLTVRHGEDVVGLRRSHTK